MYAVVGCNECAALWVVEGRPETSQCPRCGSRRQYAKRRKFLTTDDADHAREARAAMLAERQGHGDAFDDLDAFAELEEAIEEAGPSDETYLEGSGVDPDAAAAAGERATSGTGTGSRRNHQEVVRDALREVEDATEEEVVAYASQHGVDPADARTVLEKLVRAGVATENRGVYRLL